MDSEAASCGHLTAGDRHTTHDRRADPTHGRPEDRPDHRSAEVDPRRGLRELLAVSELDSPDEQWDELIAIEIPTAPGHRTEPTRRMTAPTSTSRMRSESQCKTPPVPSRGKTQHRSARAGRGTPQGSTSTGRNAAITGFETMNIIRHIRRPLLDGETVPTVPTLYEQIASIRGGTVLVIPEPTVSAHESVEEEDDDEDR